MADTAVDTTTSNRMDVIGGAPWGPYWSDVNTAIIIYQDEDLDINMARTTDAGANWTLSEIDAGDIEQIACWYDKETPGDSGTLVHIVWLDTTDTACYYRTADVSDGSLGTQRTPDATVTPNANDWENRVAITKTRNGNLLIAFYTETAQDIECLRSTDSGANWTDRADVFEANGDFDWCRLYPAETTDDADAAAIFWDVSASAITVKMYDDSANSWTETAVDSTDTFADVVHPNIDGAIRHSDGHLLIAFHSNDDATTDDLRTVDITVDSIASPTVTAKTDIFTNQGESAQTAVFINQQNDDVYVSYLKGGTWQGAIDVVFHISTDGMGVWGSEQAYSENTADDVRVVNAGRTAGDDGARYQPVFYNDDLSDIFVNEVNDIEIIAAAPEAAVVPTLTLLGVGT